MKLFVYGSLKRNESNDSLMKKCDFVREIVTKPNYKLCDCGTFPGLIHCEDGFEVRGELWDVPDEIIPELDIFEGVPAGLYKRDLVELKFYHGKAYSYFWLGATGENFGNFWSRLKLSFIEREPDLISELWEDRPETICPYVEYGSSKCKCKVINCNSVCDPASLQLWCLTDNFKNCLFYRGEEKDE